MWVPQQLKILNETLRATLRANREQIDAVRNAEKTGNEKREEVGRGIISAIVGLHTPENERTESNRYRKKAHRQQVWLTWGTWLAFIAAAVYAGFACRTLKEIEKQTPEVQKSANAAKNAAETAQHALELSNRPWIKITHQIIEPLKFNVERNLGPAAVMTVQDRIENVGPGVALNVVVWEDIFTVDVERDGYPGPHAFDRARMRQKQWCEANRHPQGNNVGYIIYPHADPFIANSVVGVLMKDIKSVEINDRNSPLDGKVSFVFTGCVMYRSAIQPADSPNHETGFSYELGIPEPDGLWMPFVKPDGIADQLRFMGAPFGYSAD